MRYLERRIEVLLARADKIVEQCGGDIYGAELVTFQRWKHTMTIAGELSAAYAKLRQEVQSNG